jgi:hypothetical protein
MATSRTAGSKALFGDPSGHCRLYIRCGYYGGMRIC